MAVEVLKKSCPIDVNLSNLAFGLSNKHFSLIIMPTEKCNFRCTYCYEDFKIGRMSDDLVGKIKKFLDARIRDPELKSLNIGWFGGEPLLESDIMIDLASFAKERCDQRNIRFTSGGTTNGYLLNEELFNKLVSLNVKYFQICLDGPKELHDLSRLRADHAGTFEVIWNNLLAIRKSIKHFVMHIRVNINRENKKQIKELILQLSKYFAGDDRFRLFLHGIMKLGGDGSKNVDPINSNELEQIVSDGYEFAKSKGLSVFILMDDIKGSYICYAASPNRFVVRADGTLAKCTVAFDQDMNNIGSINEDGTLNIDSKKFSYWSRGYQTIDAKTLHCPYFADKVCSKTR